MRTEEFNYNYLENSTLKWENVALQALRFQDAAHRNRSSTLWRLLFQMANQNAKSKGGEVNNCQNTNLEPDNSVSNSSCTLIG